jgi:hypothetical protein
MTFALTAGHKVSIAGCVIDNVKLKPLSRARVTIVAMPAEVERDFRIQAKYGNNRGGSAQVLRSMTVSRSDGLFWFVDLPEGEYRLRAEIPSLGRRCGIAEQKVLVTRDKEGSVQRATTTLTVPITRLNGKVTGNNHPNGVAMAHVRVKGSGEQAITDVHGFYSLQGIEWGKRKVVVTASGYRALPREVDFAGPGVMVEHDFQLESAAARGDTNAAAAGSGQKQQKKSAGERHV